MPSEINDAMRTLSHEIWRQLAAEPLTSERISPDAEHASVEPMRASATA